MMSSLKLFYIGSESVCSSAVCASCVFMQFTKNVEVFLTKACGTTCASPLINARARLHLKLERAKDARLTAACYFIAAPHGELHITVCGSKIKKIKRCWYSSVIFGDKDLPVDPSTGQKSAICDHSFSIITCILMKSHSNDRSTCYSVQ